MHSEGDRMHDYSPSVRRAKRRRASDSARWSSQAIGSASPFEQLTMPLRRIR
jgi:hypothetical protein